MEQTLETPTAKILLGIVHAKFGNYILDVRILK
jgi:hypothetical protein